jgi:hypothetical protein
MKHLAVFLAVGAFALVTCTVHAARTSTRLTRANIDAQACLFTVTVNRAKVENGGETLAFQVTVKAKSAEIPLSPRHWAQLEVFDGEAAVSSCRLEAQKRGGKISYSFRVAAKFTAKSQFGFYEDLSAPGGPVAGRYYWFYLDDFVAGAAEKHSSPQGKRAWNPALFEGAFMFADNESFRQYLRAADAVAVARLSQWDGEKGLARVDQTLSGKLKKDVAFVGGGGLVQAKAGDKVILVLKAEAGGMRLHSFCGAPGLYKYSNELANLVKKLVDARSGQKPDPPRSAGDPITPQMRQSLQRIGKIHGGMDQETIDAAVESLHGDISRYDPKVFVPLAVPYLLRLAPRDTQTRLLLRRALANGWMEEEFTRACLVQAGDTPGPHIRALMKALDDPDAKVRMRAAHALGATGAAGAPALPKLRAMVARAKADPTDFDRAYTLRDQMPEHVVAHVAIQQIESARKVPSPTGSAGNKREPWTGEPVAPVKWVSGGTLSTFQRLPRAADVKLLRLDCAGNQTKVELTAANFPGVLDSMKPVKADDPKYRLFHFAPWYSGEFDTPEGRFEVEFYLGGLALLRAPGGSSGLVTFEQPK